MIVHSAYRAKRVGCFLLACFVMTVGLAVNGLAVTYTYDEVGRLIKADYGSKQTITYRYDPAGNIISASAANTSNTLTVGISPSNAGTISGTGINCPGDCRQSYPGSPIITLTAKPKAGFKFLGWTGDAKGNTKAVSITMKGDKDAMAYFGAIDGNTDSDNVSDTVEMGPSGKNFNYDGNHNGVPDYQEGRAASLPTKNEKAYVTLSVPRGAALKNVRATGNPSPGDAPENIDFPFGFFSFKITGLATGACVDAELFTPLYTSISSYYKYGPIPGSSTPQWYAFSVWDGKTGEETYHETDRTRILLHFCDGLRGDSVEAQDGMIFDPGGPGAPTSAAPDIHVSSKTLSFGPLKTGDSKKFSIRVSNQAGGNLIIGSVAESDPLTDPFRIKADSCSDAHLANGKECGITVAFRPTTSGVFTDSFDIPSNDPGESPITIYLSGSGTTSIGDSDATVEPDALQPDLRVSPDSPLFGRVNVNSSMDRTVSVTNAGNADLKIGRVASADPLGAPFSIAMDGCSGKILAPGAGCSMTVRFAPAEMGDFEDSFDIPSDDPDKHPFTLKVRGRGADAAFPDITVEATDPPLARAVIGRSSLITVTVRNDGEAPLMLGAINRTNPIERPFTITQDGCTGQTLAPKGQCTVLMRFAPTATGTFKDAFEIPSNDPDENPVIVEVSGRGMPAMPPDLLLLLSDSP